MIRLLTLNLQHGAPGAGARGTRLEDADISRSATAWAVLATLAQEIQEIAPDVVALQEVDLGQPRSGRLNQAAVLAELLGWEHHRFAAAYAGPVTGLRRRPLRSELRRHTDDLLGPGRALLGEPPAGFGNALLSRLPVRAWRVQRLGRGPATIVRRGTNPLDPRSYKLFTSTMRNLLSAQIEIPQGVGLSALAGRGLADAAPWGLSGLTIASTHLATRGDTARTQLAAAWGALAELPGPHVLAGDLNLRPEPLRATGIAREVGEGATFPAGRPDHRIDHVLTDPWPVDAGGVPLRSLEPDAAGESVLQGENVPLLRATGSGVRTFVVSDHAGTWVDLEMLTRGDAV